MLSKSTVIAFVAIVVAAGLFAAKSVDNQREYKRIGILKVIDHPALDATANGVRDGLQNQLEGAQIIYESAQDDNSLAQQIIQKFLRQRVDAIVTIGTTVTQVAMQKAKNTPLFFASVTDPVGSGIVKDLLAPESNVTGISNFAPDITFKQLEFFRRILPNLKRLGIIYNSGASNSAVLVERIKAEAAKLDIDIEEVVAHTTNDAVFAAKSLLGKVDAIFIDNDNTALGAIKGIVDTSLKAKIPVFCSDIDTIQLGVLAAVGTDQYKLGEKAADMVVRAVKNKVAIKDIPVAFATDIQYVINESTAQKLGLMIPEDAKTINQDLSKISG